MHIEREKRSGLSSRFVDDKVVKGIMLHDPSSEQVAQNAYDAAEKVAYMWDDQIFLYEHKGIVSIEW